MWLNQTLPFSPMDSSFHTIRYIIFKNMYSIAPKNWYFINMVCLEQWLRYRCMTFADCRLQTADCRLQTAETADCRLQTTDCRLYIKRHQKSYSSRWLTGIFLPLTIILLLGLTLKSTKQLSTPPADVLVRAGDKQWMSA